MSLLSLPLELRFRILDFTLSDRTVSDALAYLDKQLFKLRCFPASLAQHITNFQNLQSASRQLRDESSEWLFTRTVYIRVQDWESEYGSLLMDIKSHQTFVQKMRNIVLDLSYLPSKSTHPIVDQLVYMWSERCNLKSVTLFLPDMSPNPRTWTKYPEAFPYHYRYMLAETLLRPLLAFWMNNDVPINWETKGSSGLGLELWPCLRRHLVFPIDMDMKGLAWAACNDQCEIARLLLADPSTDVNETDLMCRTALFHAADHGSIQILEYLLACGSDASKCDILGTSPFVRAAERHDQRAMLLILQMGNIHDHRDRWHRDPLFYACANGATAVVEMIAERFDVIAGADNDGCTPAMAAAAGGHYQVLKVLCKWNLANINAQDSNGETALHRAARKGHIRAVDLLLSIPEIDVNVRNIDGESPIWHAAAYGRMEIVQILLEDIRVDADAKDDCRRSPLWIAIRRDYVDIARRLIESGRVALTWDQDLGSNVIELATKATRPRLVRLLSEWCLDIGS